MSNHDAYAEIVTALQPYFDGLYDGDVAQMRRIFHPSCRLFSAPNGAATDMDMETYYARVTERPSPRSLSQARHDAIITIVASGDGGAAAVLRTARAATLHRLPESASHRRTLADRRQDLQLDDVAGRMST